MRVGQRIMVFVVVAATALVGASVPTASAVPALTYAWSPARIDGGGFVTVLAPSPRTNNLWLAGSDVAGIFRSTDGGRTWSGATRGFENPNERKVGAIEWDPFDANRAWACAGSLPLGVPTGALLRTTDAGVTWATVSRDAFCSGAVQSLAGVTTAHPRSTGRLLIADPSRRNRLWIGTLIAGVMRSVDGGTTWTSVGLGGLPIRGMALDPQDPNILYVAVRSATPGVGGIYRTANATATTPTWVRLTGPDVGEEVAIIGRRLYAAAGNQGVWAADLSAPTIQLAPVGQASLPVGPTTDVMTVSTARVGGVDTVLVGIDPDAVCLTPATWCPTVYRSTDGGATWAPLPASPAGVRVEVGGPAGPVWRQAQNPETLLGGSNHLASDVRVDPFTTSRLVVAGRAGIWRSTDSGVTWFPVTKGLTMTFHGPPATDAAVAGSVVVPTSDWNLFGTTNDGGTVQQLAFPAEGGTSARLSGFTGSGSAPLYVGVGFGAPNSELYVQETAGSPFVALGFGTRSQAAGVLAVAAREVAGQRVVVVIGRRVGIWRKMGAEPWVQVATTPGGPDGTTFASAATLAWAPDGALYAADRGNAASTGVWRSLDSGATWAQITPAMMDIAVDPTAPDRLWMAGGDEVWRVDDARTGTTMAGTLVISQRTTVAAARLVTTEPTGGVLVVTSQVPGATLGQRGTHGQVLRSRNLGRTFTVVSTDDVSRGLVEPIGIAVGPNGAVHITTFGFGWWVGRPG